MHICPCGKRHVIGAKEQLKTLAEILQITSYDMVPIHNNNHVLKLNIDYDIWNNIKNIINEYNNLKELLGSAYSGLTCLEFCANMLNKKVG